MQVLVLILSKYEKLDRLLFALNDAGIRGATIVNSTGMAQVLSKESDQLLGSIRSYFTPDRDDNRTVFMVLDEEKVEIARKVIYQVIGSLDKPGAGILFVAPVLFVEGIGNT